jgi:hypothetical protein
MKYEPLRRYLKGATANEAVLEFAEIERIIGAPLPPSARKHPAWWSNHARGHVNAHAWLDAGFQTKDVDLSSGRVTFARPAEGSQERIPGSFLERIREALGGTIKVMPGVDLTDPLWLYEQDDL